MVVFYIIFAILVVAILIITFVALALNNFKEYTIRINEAEANIEATLNKRFDLLNKSNDIIKSKIETDKEELLKTISTIRSQKLDNFELDKKLYKAIEEFHEYAEENIGLKEDEEYSDIERNLIDHSISTTTAVISF